MHAEEVEEMGIGAAEYDKEKEREGELDKKSEIKIRANNQENDNEEFCSYHDLYNGVSVKYRESCDQISEESAQILEDVDLLINKKKYVI